MSSTAPQIEATSAEAQPEQQQQQQLEETQQQETQTSPDAAATTDTPAPKEEEKAPKPNPLKKLTSVFKTLFGCLRKPAVRDEQLEEAKDGGVKKAVEDGHASETPAAADAEKAAAPAVEQELPGQAIGEEPVVGGRI
ncbi:hypothetical protein C8A01DRAFT_34835 [Parachaetomium inaequale]|uniref:Uncharacterized protein n=1 Tax=Parachaetomium inaequale TaxID=2588326 RepID=A0AAN6PHK1_9PEZI|nr:hypothetical protein C8A01DRAFT_34835 [Parachaetomium inaequale]